MEEEAKRIIVFAAYDTVVEANLVKTKLDAYGIPCFLSEENFNQMYPFRNGLFTGVRLHIFEEDRDQVTELLKDEEEVHDNVLHCPQCLSTAVDAGELDSSADWREALSVYLFLKPRTREFVCRQCGHRWT